MTIMKIGKLIARKCFTRRAFLAMVASLLPMANMPLAEAKDLFSSTTTVGNGQGDAGSVRNDTRSVSFSTAEQTLDFFRTQNLQAVFPTYNEKSTVFSDINFRGLPLRLEFPDFGSTLLKLNIPDAAISRSFQGATREESVAQLRAFFRNGDELGKVVRALARASPVEPVAGNSNSLQARMVMSTFQRGMDLAVNAYRQSFELDSQAARAELVMLAQHSTAQTRSDQQPSVTLPSTKSVGASRSSSANMVWVPIETHIDGTWSSSGGYRRVGIEIPLTATIPVTRDGTLMLGLSLQSSTTQGADEQSGALSVAYAHDVGKALGLNRFWLVDASTGYGATVSRDLGGAGHVANVGLGTSYLLSKFGDLAVLARNQAIYSKVLSASYGGYGYQPDINNTIVANGVLLTHPVGGLGPRYSLQYFFYDVRMYGTPALDRYEDRIGITLLRRIGDSAEPRALRATLSLLRATETRRVALSLELLL